MVLTQYNRQKERSLVADNNVALRSNQPNYGFYPTTTTPPAPKMDRAGTKREIIQSNEQNDGSPSTKRARQSDNNQPGGSQQQQQQQQQNEQGQQQFQTIQLRYPEQMQVGLEKSRF